MPATGQATPATTSAANAPGTTLAPSQLDQGTGGGEAHNNLQPYLAINWCIALQGIFPART